MHPLVAEFYQRRRLAAIGYSFPSEDLDPERVEAFDLIVETIGEANRGRKPRKG